MSIIKQIEDLMAKKRYQEALALCEANIGSSDGTQSIKIRQAQILHEIYRYDEAFSIVRSLGEKENTLLLEAAIIIDWVSDFQYKNCKKPPFKIDEFLTKAIANCDRVSQLNPGHRSEALYFKANALSAMGRETESRLLLHQILDNHPVPQNIRAVINLGNSYQREGRFVEAVAIYKEAIGQETNFSMGWSGLGSGLSHAFYQTGQDNACLLYMALFCYDRAIGLVDLHKTRYVAAAESGRDAVLACFHEKPNEAFIANWNPIPYGRENIYKSGFKDFFYKTALEQDLFLNLCLGCRKDETYSRDKFLVGGISSKLEDCRTPYNLFSYLSEIRRDYFVARFLLIKARHDADRELSFLNSIYDEIDLLDYCSGELKNELLKMSLQKSMGIFDKIAFFLNEYECLNVSHHNVYFSTKGKKADVFKHLEKKYNNFAGKEISNLRALKSLAEDFKHPYFEKCKTLRDSITHKYLKVHLDLVSSIEQLYYPGNCTKIIKSVKASHEDHMNPTNYHILEKELGNTSLAALKMARAAIFYLAGHVKCTELRKSKGIIIPSLYFDNILKKQAGRKRRRPKKD